MANNTYQLENPSEPLRLELQAKSNTYSLEDEMNKFNITMKANDQIIDVGCGTGVLSRFLANRYFEKNMPCSIVGIDSSLIQLQEAKTHNKNDYQSVNIQYLHHSIIEENNLGQYHKIFCRYVLQHLPSIELRYQSLRNILKLSMKKSEIFLIDSFGAMSHFDTDNEWLRKKIPLIEENSTIDLNIGLKLRGMLIDIGLKPYQMEVMALPLTLKNLEEREAEALNWTKRLWHAMPLLENILGPKDSKKFLIEFPQAIVNQRSLLLAQRVLIKITI